MHRSLGEAFAGICTNHRGIRFVSLNGQEEYLSYSQLYSDSRSILGGLQELNMHKGDELVFQYVGIKEYVLTFWACILGGIIPVPVTVGQNDNIGLKIMQIWMRLKAPKLITTKDYAKNLKNVLSLALRENQDLEDVGNDILRNMIDYYELSLEAAGEIAVMQPSDIAYLQFSSGSTGESKGVTLSQKNILTNVEAIVSGSKADCENDRSISWMPLTHDMGLIGMHITPLLLGADQYLMSPFDFLRKPFLLFDKITEHRITMMAIPNFGYGYILERMCLDKYYDWDLSSVSLIFNGAEMISYPLITRFLDVMQKYGLKKNAMFNVYGMAEASLAVTFPAVGSDTRKVTIDREHLGIGEQVIESREENQPDFVLLGSAVQCCKFKIIDDAGIEVVDMTVGNISIKGENVTKGYYGMEDVTKKVISEEGWLATGDIGFIYKGELVVIGRKKNIIIVNGQNYYCSDLEEIAIKCTKGQNSEIAVVGNKSAMGEEILVFVRYNKDLHQFVSIDQDIRKGFFKEAALSIKEIIPVVNLPKTTSGKVRYFQLSKDYQAGRYVEVLERFHVIKQEAFASRTIVEPVTDMEKALVQIFQEVLGVSDIGMTDGFMEYGIQSLQVYQLFERIQSIYPNRIRISDLYNSFTITEVAERMRDKKDLGLKTIPMPENFICIDESRIGYESLYVNIKDREAINRYMDFNHITLQELFSAFLAYILWNITGEAKIPVYAILKELCDMYELKLDFSIYGRLKDVYDYIQNESDHWNTDQLKWVRRDRNTNQASFLICNRNLPRKVRAEVEEVFDIVCEIYEDTRQIGLQLYYFCGKFTEDAVRVISELFEELIQKLVVVE